MLNLGVRRRSPDTAKSSTASMAFADTDSSRANTPIAFPSWQISLAWSELPGAVQPSHERKILAFLRIWRAAHAATTVALTRLGDGDTPARVALRWFVHLAAGKQVRRVVSLEIELHLTVGVGETRRVGLP